MALAFTLVSADAGPLSLLPETDKEVVVDSVSMVRSMSIVSTIPAERSVISSVQGSPAVVIDHVAVESVMLLLGVHSLHCNLLRLNHKLHGR